MRRPSFLPLALATICGLTAPAIPGRTQVALEAVSREEAVRLALERNPAAVGARGRPAWPRREFSRREANGSPR